MSLALFLLAFSAVSQADGRRLAAARDIIENAGLPVMESLDHDQTIATAQLLLRTQRLGPWLRRQREGLGQPLLFRVTMSGGKVVEIGLADDPIGDPGLTRKVARKLGRTHAAWDIDAEVLLPVVVGRAR
jgi:hypothetical protein